MNSNCTCVSSEMLPKCSALVPTCLWSASAVTCLPRDQLNLPLIVTSCTLLCFDAFHVGVPLFSPLLVVLTFVLCAYVKLVKAFYFEN